MDHISRPLSRPHRYPFLSGGGALGELIASFDWSFTALGPIANWHQSVRSAVGLALRSPVPIVLLFGESGVMIYNDAYSVFAAGRHPDLLGSNVREGWPEVAAFNDSVIKTGLSGNTLTYRDQVLTLHRNGVAEEVWLNLDYSPILDEAGDPIGVMAIVVETTDKVRAERWLTGERERLRQMFDQAPGFMAMLTGPEHVFDLVNPAYLQLVGHRDVQGKTIRQALPEIEGQGFLELLDEVFIKGEPYSGFSVPVGLQATSGGAIEERFLDFVYQPVRNPDDVVVGIFVQGTDATDRVRAEQAAHASEAQFQTFAQVMPNHVWTALPDGRLDWFNERVYAYSGAMPGELDGAKWAAIVHPDDMDATATKWAAALQAGEIYETEFRLRRADGQYRWHIARAFPIRGSEGKILRWIGTNTDIEEQKGTAEALAFLNASLEEKVAERTADLDRMWRLSSDVMVVASFNAAVVAINPAWTELLGWSEDELIGRSFLDLVHPDDVAATLAEVEKLGQGTKTFRFENRYLCKNGGYCTLSWMAVPDDKFIHAVGRDVTSERAAADTLRRTEIALQQSQKMEAIGNLTGGVAHDFNNLLQVIAGNLQLLAKDIAGNERAERRVASATAGVSRGAKLASQLLAFGRRQALEPRVLNVGRLAYGIEEMLRRTIGEAIALEVVISGGLWNALVDPVQMENVILNLAINSRDAMDGNGKLTIEVGNAFLDDFYVRLHSDVQAGQYVMLAVSDTGSGMPPDVMEKVFEPFFSTKPEGKGTGLGLSMVYGFVKQSGGHVKIYSEVGQGTTIKLYLPRVNASEDVAVAEDPTPITGGTETVLVVEDDEGVRTTVVELLSDLGYRVLKANDATSALSVIESGMAIDVLFTDVVMPGELKSTELARRVRQRQPNIAVLFTSGYTENSIVHDGRLDSGVELLSKPYTREALARKIRQIITGRDQRKGFAPATPLLPDARVSEREIKQLEILFVEDDLLIRMNTSEFLKDLGHRVVEAGSGEEALGALEQTTPDILLTDVGLPGMSGFDLAVRANALRPGISVIFATGNTAVPEIAGLRPTLLAKPYSERALEEALRAAASL